MITLSIISCVLYAIAIAIYLVKLEKLGVPMLKLGPAYWLASILVSIIFYAGMYTANWYTVITVLNIVSAWSLYFSFKFIKTMFNS